MKDFEARLFQNNQLITSTDDGGAIADDSTFAGKRNPDSCFQNPENCRYTLWTFDWKNFRVESLDPVEHRLNSGYTRENPNGVYTRDKSGEYTVKIFYKGQQVREAKFTVQPNGWLEPNKFAAQMPLDRLKAIIPVKIMGALDKYNAAANVVLTGCGAKPAATDTANTMTANTTVVKNTPTGTVPETKSTFPATEEGAKTMLKEFAKPGADTTTLSKQPRPTKADYEWVFDAEFAAKAMALYDPAWEAGKMVLTTNDPARTEVILYPSTSDDVKSWKGAVAKDFAGGWKDVAAHLKPGVKIYRFDFVEPGKTVGMVYEGLVNINGNWRIFPKPWRAVS